MRPEWPRRAIRCGSGCVRSKTRTHSAIGTRHRAICPGHETHGAATAPGRPCPRGRDLDPTGAQLVDAGILPPTERTETGYRVFTEAHRAALLTYRALLRGFGPEAAREVMRAVHLGKVSRALARIDAEHAALHTQRTE